MGWAKDRIADEAARWVVLIDSEAFDASAAMRFRHWFSKSIDHRQAFRLASRAWSDLDQLAKLKRYPDIAALLATPEQDMASAPAAPDMKRRALIAGAGLGAVALGLGGYISLSASSAEAYETEIGEQREVDLADGTRVWLNAKTRLEARIERNQRHARLTAGEALFMIAESSPPVFSIATSSGEIEAASGEILVKLVPGGARVALLSEGARAISRTWLGAPAPVAAGANSEITFAGRTLAVEAANSERLARRTLWRQGMLAFDDTPLSEATADMTRQSGVRFVFADPALADLRVGGLVRADDMDAFLALLHTNLAIRSERRDGAVVLSSSAPQ